MTNEEPFCLANLLFLCVTNMHINIMTDKGFNLFDECASRCVHAAQQVQRER